MSKQLELLTESPSQWSAVVFVTPEIQKKEIKPFVLLALKELEGTPDSRTSSLLNGDKYSAVRSVVRHVTRLRSATKEAWSDIDMRTFLEGLKFSPECVTELTTLLCADQIYRNLQNHLQTKPGVVNLQWKIDVSLSQANIQAENADHERSKEIIHRDTRVIMTLTLTNGQINIYRLSIIKFQELSWLLEASFLSEQEELGRSHNSQPYASLDGQGPHLQNSMKISGMQIS